ncbi:VIT1/CCC1 transporter family protein [Histidinibacterium aquaticum]|uniref:GMP synthase n=1 Tax=Histidinibacterium aquaticum TaxID=2613962 RepID=A0A5J5GLQ0_9RHOB|nr:VIT1/CCC1 transporter family protein [Histidinibacterium aquaticum]KAA9009211.1 GMP synthase [Histidinibacterium aquaticum]
METVERAESVGGRLAGARQFLRQIVYGGNDGIVTTFAIVAGFAGAEAQGTAQIGTIAVLVFGLSNLMADGVSMGLGEVLSSRSQAKLHAAERRRRHAALTERPEAERTELETILRDRGMPPDRSGRVAEEMMAAPDLVADLMMTYRLKMPDAPGGNVLVGGLSTFLAFVFFGLLPLLPYVLMPPLAPATFGVSVAATALALGALGLLRATATGERVVAALVETLALGGLCAAVAYGVGALVAG